MRVKIRALGSACVLLSTLAACGPIFGSAGKPVVGILEYRPNAVPDPGAASRYPAGVVPLDELEAVVRLPDTVRAGAPFAVEVGTVGLGACYEAAGAETESAGNVAVITPLDRLKDGAGGDEMPCTLGATVLYRTVRLTFAQPGEAVVRVKGRRIINGDVRNATEVVLERRVVVR